MAANMDGLSKGISAINRKKPLNGMQVRVMAYAKRNANTTTKIVETIAMKRLLKKDPKICLSPKMTVSMEIAKIINSKNLKIG